MSVLGHEQESHHVRVMSVIRLKVDIHQRGLHVRLASGSKTDRSTDIAGVLGAEADISRPRSTARPVTLVATEG